MIKILIILALFFLIVLDIIEARDGDNKSKENVSKRWFTLPKFGKKKATMSEATMDASPSVTTLLHIWFRAATKEKVGTRQGNGQK